MDSSERSDSSTVTNAIQAGQRHQGDSGQAGINVLFGDEVPDTFPGDISPEVLNGLLTPNGGRPLSADRFSPESFSRTSEEHAVRETAAFKDPIECTRLPSTKVTPTSGTTLSDGNTVVYCPTMALAWKRYIREMPQVSQTALAAELFKSDFSETDISPSALDIRISTAADSGPGVLCRLKKHLAFASEFDAFKQPMTFFGTDGEHSVRAFGVTSHWYEWRAALDQIRVIDYASPNDFVIAIRNVSGEDLVLAKIPKPDTLQTGLSDVTRRLRDSRLPISARSVIAQEEVVIPLLELSVSAQFSGELNPEDQPPDCEWSPRSRLSSFDWTNEEPLCGLKPKLSGERELRQHPWNSPIYL